MTGGRRIVQTTASLRGKIPFLYAGGTAEFRSALREAFFRHSQRARPLERPLCIAQRLVLVILLQGVVGGQRQGGVEDGRTKDQAVELLVGLGGIRERRQHKRKRQRGGTPP